MITWQQLEQSAKDIVRVLKSGKREQAAFAITAVFFSAGFAIGGKLAPDFEKDSKWIVGLKLALYSIGAIAFVYGVIRVWRLVPSSDSKETKNIPLEIKGLEAFTEADGELFRKLGRESELRNLLGLVLNEQLLMVVVRGASGAGKTSLLRAGLKHILKNNPDGKDVQFHYWEAVPTEPDKGLLRALQEKWPEGATKPVSLDELVNPADALGRQSHVIVLDQFEQLRGNRKVFQLLRRIVRESKPPHRITWVIAFRREFSADWMDFASPEIERGIRPPQDISLRLFTAEQAREVIGQLVNESDLKDSIEQSVINNLVEAATVEGEVSPVDIGIGLLVLAELHERQSGKTITIRDYQFAGGAEGLLTQYISRCLDLFPKEHQEAILKAMLALRDAETNQRLAEGLTVDELATEAGTDARTLKTQLNRLADRDTRLLEIVTPADGSPMRYRLPHERLIPALYRLTGKLLAEVDQAKLKFQNAFQAWKTNDKRSAYLLKAKELKLVERFESQIPWGNDEQEKKGFLNRSKRHRQFIRAAAITATLAFIVSGWVALQFYQRSEHKKYLSDESGYPAELYDYQHQLKKLELTEPLNLDRFTWLSSDSIEELSLKAAESSNSIAGLASLSKCRSLKKLTLDLTRSQVSNLEPLSKLSNLQQLRLDLGQSQVSDLEPLMKLSNLKQLTLNLSGRRESKLEPLAKLSNLTQLTLDLGKSEESDLDLLARLSNLTQLTLDYSYSDESDLEPLAKLSNLRQLTLNLESSAVHRLEPLARLSNLDQLTLNLTHSQISDLEPLAKLSNLKLDFSHSPSQEINLGLLAKLSSRTQLTLDLSESRVGNLEPLAKLSNLKQLMLDLGYYQISDLEQLAKLSNLTQLTLNLHRGEVSDLEPLAKLSNLTQLTLDLSANPVSNLQPLAELGKLAQLTLDLSASSVSNLEPLAKLSNKTQLTLGLRASEVSDLEWLVRLSNLTQLTLDFSSRVGNLEPLSKLSNLQQLTLDLSGSQVSDLKPLEQLKELTSLTLKLRDEFGGTSEVKNFEMLDKLLKLQSLSIERATTEQRKSLRKIPASLTVLRF